MRGSDILVLNGRETLALLTGREAEVMEAVSAAYVAHARQQSSLPHSTFLRFPDNPRNRIIALPSYLGGEFAVAGMKWISSFPGNLEKGIERASAAMILNSTKTGQAEALLEGSVISAKRTAASAALAARVLHGRKETPRVGLVGAGRINYEIVRFLRAVYPELRDLVVYDLYEARARQFGRKCVEMFEGVRFKTATDLATVLKSSTLLSFATTTLSPYLSDLSACAEGTTLLHVSLRDLGPEAILSADNVVDDIDHVCRAETSVHLAEQSAGDRSFIRGSLAEVMSGDAPPKADAKAVTVFSPFGLGILDIAVGKLVCELARAQNSGQLIESFQPDLWLEERPAYAHAATPAAQV